MSTEGNIIEKLVAILKDLLLGKSKQVPKRPKEEKAFAPVCPALKGLPAKAASSPPKAQPSKDGNVKRRGMLKAKNDSQRIKDELVTLRKENRELYNLSIDLYKWIDKEFGKDTVITMIYRTQKEQDEIYAGTFRGTRSYDKNPWKSPHQVWTALDIRSKIYTEEEIYKIKKYLNDKYNSSNYYKTTAMYHEVTNAKGEKLGKHFHIQYAKK